MLKKERLTFGNQLESLEFQLKKQDEEINKLRVREREGKYSYPDICNCSALYHAD